MSPKVRRTLISAAAVLLVIVALIATAVRLPVSPGNWRSDSEYLWRSLEPTVRMASQAGLWVVIDWHVIGNLDTGVGTNSDGAGADMNETIAFWQTVAPFFKDAPNVLYELVNECEGVPGTQWRTMTQSLVDTVRATGADNIVIVGGVQWSKDLSWAAESPLTGDDIAYAVHIYPGDSATTWAHGFGDFAATHTVLLTEWGFTGEPMNPDDTYLVGDVATYAQPLLDYIQARHMGWVACWYDSDYDPPMLTIQGNPTPWGDLAFAAMMG
ncbi:MAG: glycoside hydrolase family 5 protein [Propionibacteriaceae bacterium]|nr:glycoside hydrolase family 5 protein [Propionibacteriaceae bacterium]